MRVLLTKAKRCPRCGSGVIDILTTGPGGAEFFAVCRHCFKYGDTAPSHDEAVSVWNRHAHRVLLVGTKELPA